MSKRILVSGATGQLGKELATISKTNADLSFEFCDKDSLDLSSIESIESQLSKGYDLFINAGAYTAVDKAEEDVDLCYKINSTALGHIGQLTPKTTKIIHLSSDYVYHNGSSKPMSEESITEPKGIYAKSKLEGENLLLTHRPEALVIRTSWVYSSFGHNFVKTMIRLGQLKDELTIVADQIGAPTYARDIAHAIIKMYRGDLQGIYNYSNEGQTHWADYARKIFEFTNISCHVIDTTTEAFGAAAPRPAYSVLAKDKLYRDLDIKIPHWEESLQKCLIELGFEL